MDVSAHVLSKPVSFPLLLLAYKRTKLGLFGGGEFVEAKRGILLATKREVRLGGNTLGHNSLWERRS